MKIKFVYYLIVISCTLVGSELEVLTYNIHALSPILAGDDPHGRIPKILSKSSGNNIIFFQENWIFSDQYFNEYLPEHQILASKSSKFIWPFSNGSGLTVALSDSITILETNDISYSSCSGWLSKDNDCLATKGFQHIRIQIAENVIDLYNTHLDAGDSDSDIESRVMQIKELENYAIQESRDLPIIIAGDLNIDFNSDELHVVDSFCDGLDLNIAEWSNSSEDTLSEKLDYILYRGSGDTNILLRGCNIDAVLNGLSDHPPIKATFN